MGQTKHNCNTCVAKTNNIFGVLVNSRLAQIDLNKTPHEYKRGQIIFYEGNPAFALYCISKGRVKIYKMLKNGEQKVIRILIPGELLGYRSLLADEPYAATAEAIEHTVICAIPKDTFIKVLRQSPDLALKFLAKMAVELRTSEDQIIILKEFSARQRTAQLLISLIDNPNKPNPVIKGILSRNEMAQMIGVMQETFSRTLHYFLNQGIIEISRSDISIIDLKGLNKYAQGLKK